MGKEAIISIDGHVKGSRQTYRDYVPKKFIDAYDEQVKAAEEAGLRDAGTSIPNSNPRFSGTPSFGSRIWKASGWSPRCSFPTGSRSRSTGSTT